MSLDEALTRIGWAPNPLGLVFLQEREHLDTETEGDRGKVMMWGIEEEHHAKVKEEMAADFTGQGKAEFDRKPPDAKEEEWNRFFLTALRRGQPCQHLHLRLLEFYLLSPELWENELLFFKAPSLRDFFMAKPKNLIQIQELLTLWPLKVETTP